MATRPAISSSCCAAGNFDLIIWIRFVWQVSRIPLRLVATHPDRVGGLGFLAGTAEAFTLLAVAHGALLSGQLANRILFLGATLPDFKMTIALVVVFLVLLVISPLLIFAPQLMRAKHAGLREFGTLAERYVRELMPSGCEEPRGGRAVRGHADIQSLADLGNSFEVVRTMRFTPVTKDMVVRLGLATLAPVVPLALTMMPLDQLVRTLVDVLF